jgi:methylase of polypeptide subunit release factors
MADKLVDQVRSVLAENPTQIEAARFMALETLLIRSLILAPDFVNAYYWLAELRLRSGYSSGTAYSYLSRTWERYGGGNPSALQFINEYQHGQPYRFSEQLHATNTSDLLVLHMSDDLQYLDILEYNANLPYCRLNFVGRVEHPHLICSPYDCRMLPAAKQTILEDLLKRGKDTRVVGHHGTWIQVQRRRVFGPAIDTLYYNKVLYTSLFRHPELMAQMQTAFEVGTGTGFLLCSVVRAFKQRALRIIASNINPIALHVAQRNVARVIQEEYGAHQGKPQVTFVLNEHSLELCANGSVDLLFTSPPYIPECRTAFDSNPYEGMKVIEDILLNNEPRILSPSGLIIMLYSSLSAKHVQHYLAKSPLVAIPLGSPHRVPLDLREVNNNPSWVEVLRHRYNLEEDLSHPRYAFWHCLHMVALCHKTNSHVLQTLTSYGAATKELVA